MKIKNKRRVLIPNTAQNTDENGTLPCHYIPVAELPTQI